MSLWLMDDVLVFDPGLDVGEKQVLTKPNEGHGILQDEGAGYSKRRSISLEHRDEL